MRQTPRPMMSLLLVGLLAACGGPSEENNASNSSADNSMSMNNEENNEENSTSCTEAPSCEGDEVEVDACEEGDASCREVTVCEATIYCAEEPASCEGLPACEDGEVEVDSCEQGDASCREVTVCEATIYCAEEEEEPACECEDSQVWVNACEEWDEECVTFEGCEEPVSCKIFTPPEYPLDGDACDYMAAPGEDPDASTTALLTAFVEASAGEVICLSNGYYRVTEQLSLAAGVEVRGETMEGVILDFEGQQTGANGILAQPGPDEPIVFTQMTVKNTSGDGIRVEKADRVTFRYVTATWDGGPSEDNGAYGIYPVQSSDVLVEHSKAYNASDAGIYVGQSSNILVHHNEAAYNVAGIEIENSNDAEVRDNDAHDNTGGVLVFNLPNLEVKTGSRTKVHNNRIVGNNTDNFAPPMNIVAQVPTGSGVLIIAADDAEIHDNIIEDHRSVGIAVLSYQATQRDDYEMDAEYDPYSEGHWIHDNVLENNGYDPPPTSLAGLIATLSGLEELEDLLWGGFIDETKPAEDRRSCWSDNVRPDMATAVPWRNIDAPNILSDTSGQSTELGEYACTKEPLPSITIPGSE